MEGGFVKTRPLRPLEAVRSFGVMLGGSIALAAAAAASSVAVALMERRMLLGIKERVEASRG